MGLKQNSECLIAQCISKDGKISLRPMFGEEHLLIYADHKNGINEGDIILFNRINETGESSQLIYKKESIINRYLQKFEKTGINPLFSGQVMQEVGNIIADPGIDDPDLSDFTQLPFVTIDNDGSKDLDQAVYVEKKKF